MDHRPEGRDTELDLATTQVYKGPGSSAELIVEAPPVGRSVATMSNYSFTSGSAIDEISTLRASPQQLAARSPGLASAFSTMLERSSRTGPRCRRQGPRFNRDRFQRLYGAVEQEPTQ